MGQVEVLQTGTAHKVRWVTLRPNSRIPECIHLNRAENWVVVEGTGRIFVDGIENLVSENGAVFVPKGSSYSIENPGKAILKLVEVLTGPYLEDDDVTNKTDNK